MEKVKPVDAGPYGFWLALCVIIAGTLLGTSLSEKVQPVDVEKLAERLLAPMEAELKIKDQRIKSLDRALNEAITALIKANVPVKIINAALKASSLFSFFSRGVLTGRIRL